MGICQSSHNEKQKRRNQSQQVIQVKQEGVQQKEFVKYDITYIKGEKKKFCRTNKNQEKGIVNNKFSINYPLQRHSEFSDQARDERNLFRLNCLAQHYRVNAPSKLNQERSIKYLLYFMADQNTFGTYKYLVFFQDNPHIVQVIDILEEKRFIYIIDEFCPDGPLKQFVLRDKILEEKFASQICAQILSCLDYIQGCQFNHNRLSLDSFYLCNTHLNFLVKLVDYRNLYEKDSLSKQNIRFCAPEILKDQKKHQIESDIWSLGIIAYELLSGKSPYKLESSTLNEISSEIFLQQKYLTNMDLDVSDPCKQFIQSVLQCDINSRPTIKQCLKMPWIISGLSLSNKYSKLLYNLSQAKPKSYLQQCILIMIIDVYEIELKNEIELIFHKFALNNQNEINKSELKEMFQQIFQNKSIRKFSEQVFSKLDTDNDGQITLQEFVIAAVNKSQIITDLRIKNIYNDLQQGGFITHKSIFKKVEGDKNLMLKTFNDLPNHKLTYDQFKQLVDNIN